MIRANPNSNHQPSRQIKARGLEILREAQIAIAQGVRQGDAVAELEYLGLPVRTINMLENSRFQITSLEDLVTRSRDELLEIPNFGKNGLHELLKCLSRYDQLDDAKRRVAGPPATPPTWFER